MFHDAAALLAFDREHIWHPYTSMTDPTPVRLVVGAQGTRLHLADGREVIDGMSSWWAAIHGHNHPELIAALTEQASRLAHVMFGGLTHAPAIRLSHRLIELTPQGLEHVFLADSGSVSVEVALKMALQYQRGVGRPARSRMLTISGGYHGDTFGAMSVCDPERGMHAMYADLLPQHVFAPRPPASYDEDWAAEFRSLAARHRDELAGLIVEPLVQGAGGMWVYDPAYLRLFRDVADEFELVLIFDEIATGFGRTGHLFAADAGPVTPDVMCLGKALTGGVMTLAATLCTTRIARGLSASESGVLNHGPTYMGNPLACAVALASLDLLVANDWSAQVTGIHAALVDGLAPVRSLPGVRDVRILGAIGAVQLDHSVDMVAATDAGLDEGVWLRPFGDLIYTMPPFVSTPDELRAITSAIRAAVAQG